MSWTRFFFLKQNQQQSTPWSSILNELTAKENHGDFLPKKRRRYSFKWLVDTIFSYFFPIASSWRVTIGFDHWLLLLVAWVQAGRWWGFPPRDPVLSKRRSPTWESGPQRWKTKTIQIEDYPAWVSLTWLVGKTLGGLLDTQPGKLT